MTRTSLILPLFLLACTGDADVTPTATTPDPMTMTPATPAATDLVDIALADEQFSILAGAVVDAGLEATLRGAGPFTVFAPTNAAFESAGIDLSTLTTEQLAEILTHHVVAAEVDSTTIPNRATSVADYTLFFDISDGVKVDRATVTTADVRATNGILHVIDQVLLPPTLLDAAELAGLTGLAGAVGAADPAVASVLDSPGSYTVMAPTNQAFEDAASVTAGLTPAELADVLTYHVFDTSVTAATLPAAANTLLINEWGDPVTALISTEGAAQVNGVDIVDTDIKTTNGIVHVVDSVLLPPTLVDHATNAGLSELLATVGAASGDLGTTLSGPGPFTVFAPTNQAFMDITDTTATLTPAELENVLLYHVIGGDDTVRSSDLVAGDVPTLQGSNVTVAVSPITINGADVVIADVHGTNGTVHVVDTVLLPPPAPAPTN